MSKKKRSAPEPGAEQLSPNEFMRARRPERFSDSTVSDEAILDRSLLEYHLSTITSRSQEVAFATFARHLAEREICPNLLPQTGPTGGGDSKVDAETYPVAEDLALGWHTGVEAASERWGFAFSAKKAWKDKVTSDVDKAVATGRGYAKVFFVSNQYIRDKTRAEVEDQLRRKHGVDVRILDRTWILDKVFSNQRQALAIDDLQIATSTRREMRKGPRDAQRELDLKEIEQRIQISLTEGSQGLQLVEDCMEAAELARGLERPRTEVDGLYERAERIAAKYGTSHQRLECAYARAWTTFWWYEDYERFSELYGLVEERVNGSENPYDLELLSNLWGLLHNAAFQHKLDEGVSAIATRTATLSTKIENLSRQEERPSAALHARSLRLVMQLNLSAAAHEPMEPILREFHDVVRSCEGLVGFPLEPLVAILTELGDSLGELPEYAGLFETLVAVQERRRGDVAAARMLLTRGAQQLKADHPYDAIRTLGLSLRRLYKHESRGDAVRALYLLGCAYERTGLLWAARGTLLSAASLATSEFSTYGHVTPSQAACYRRLKWVELQLGRVPQTLAWHEVDTVVRHVLAEKGKDEGVFAEDETAFDAILGILLLKADFWELKRLSALPDVLDGLGLFSAWAALMYALGYEKELQEEFFTKNPEDTHAFFLKWRDQPASKELPEVPALYEEQKVTLRSRLIGCDITVKSDNVSPCVDLAESVLAALESLLSTGTVRSMAVREPVLTISVRKSDFAQEPFEFELQDRAGRPHVEILCSSFDPHSAPATWQAEFQKKLSELLATIFPRIVMTDNVLAFFEELVRDESGFERSISFTGSLMTVANVLGSKPKSRLSDWFDSKTREFPSQRRSAWDADDVPSGNERQFKAKPLTPGTGEPPEELLDLSRLKQNEIRNVSLIRETLWDRAGWFGTLFAMDEGDDSPPILGLMFSNPDAAKQIFECLRSDLGARDAEERLRIAIVRGVNKGNPTWYRVVLGTSLDSELRKRGTRYVVSTSRISTMTPDSNANLDRFLRRYEKVKGYLLAAAASSREAVAPQFVDCPYLMKSDLYVRQAWEIGRNDPDGAAILDGDEPIIPPDQNNPPVTELLRWKRARPQSRD
jgi:hypothetical protein